MTLLRTEVLITKADLGFATIHGEIMIIEFIETRRTETSRIGGSEAEIAWGIHQRGLRRKMVVERLMMRQSKAQGECEVALQLRLVLGIGCERIHMLIDIARGSVEILLSPVGSEDGGRMFGQRENRLHITLHHQLFLGLHIIAYGIGLGCHIVLLTIAETIDGKVGLQRVLGIKFIDTTQVPAEALIAHLVVVATRDVLTGFRTIGNLI